MGANAIRLAAFVCGLTMVTLMASAQEEKINVKEWEAAARLLADTAAMIEKNGWQQGAVETVPQDCMATALEKAFRANPEYTLVDLNYAKAVFDAEIGATEPAVAILKDAKDEPAVPYWGIEYMKWNDVAGQTKEAVIGTIRAAAGKAAMMSKAAAAQ